MKIASRKTSSGTAARHAGASGSRTLRALGVALVCGTLLAGCGVRPKPLSEPEQAAFGKNWLDRSTRNQEPIGGPVGLYEAMARALKYNLDVRVEVMERALRLRDLTIANQSMLPDLVASSVYSGRNEADPSASSTRDPDFISADLAFSWNILDFGLSYVRAKQAADEALVQEEMRRKVVNRLIEDVRTAYWRAASYDQLVKRMRGLEKRVQRALAQSRQISGDGENSPLTALLYQRELLVIEGRIKALEGETIAAKTQLSALMNVAPGTNFTLKPVAREAFETNLPDNLQDLFHIAVAKRSEMRELAYRLRINDEELSASILQILPNFNLYAGLNHNTNEFILPADWVSWGGRMTWNLIKTANLPATKQKIDAQERTIEARAQSVAMAIMTQVQVSRIRYAHLMKRYKNASELASVGKKILGQAEAEAASDRATEQKLIQEQMNALLADAQREMAYADAQAALAKFYAALGLDPLPKRIDVRAATVANITSALEASWEGNSATPSLLVAETKIIQAALAKEKTTGLAAPVTKTSKNKSASPIVKR
jgi:outer membrane protein TolC